MIKIIFGSNTTMAAVRRKQSITMASNLLKTLTGRSFNFPSNSRSLSGEIITSHTAKWMQDASKKSPMELINEVPPIKVEGRIAACEGDTPALGHPIEFICLDMNEPAVCKYCGLRYVQDHHH
ncbi:NADH dehydrogenase [ubiquinone] iron-sulfur protein 6, mitochondrial [Nicotiana tabacum]|uniref:NADH dehydrogenase [ubiquinone] iron-sulfur protein 6, mitochondrial n=1 Tax=Nicotiana tabacum TaxID=4097 RepID=A0A1S4DHB7_TOBAC|nr:NADH dehydrogenase [ubiquinone] iron-sulfur protein 6, mitochondrial-like [Nicotiana tomentosiformis]XP_016512741.1 PREDICTED: NADH dehydrogenase [ubiquinone] iron-sulfur protein 6, mitochondrial-like [Nicotiana tabacum]